MLPSQLACDPRGRGGAVSLHVVGGGQRRLDQTSTSTEADGGWGSRGQPQTLGRGWGLRVRAEGVEGGLGRAPWPPTPRLWGDGRTRCRLGQTGDSSVLHSVRTEAAPAPAAQRDHFPSSYGPPMLTSQAGGLQLPSDPPSRTICRPRCISEATRVTSLLSGEITHAVTPCARSRGCLREILPVAAAVPTTRPPADWHPRLKPQSPGRDTRLAQPSSGAPS